MPLGVAALRWSRTDQDLKAAPPRFLPLCGHPPLGGEFELNGGDQHDWGYPTAEGVNFHSDISKNDGSTRRPLCLQAAAAQPLSTILAERNL